MNHIESKSGDNSSKANGVSGGLRILARIIARQLVARKSGADAGCPSKHSRVLMPDSPARKEARNGRRKTNR